MIKLDILLTILLLVGLVRGFIKGFIFEIAVLGTLFICYFLGFRAAHYTGEYLSKITEMKPATLHYISLVTAWIGISVGVFFLAKLFEGLINIAALGIFNKVAGAVFGLFKYAFIISLILFFTNRFEIKWLSHDTKAESALYYPLLKIAPALLPL